MSNPLADFFGRIRDDHPYLGYIVGGLLIVLDNIGRVQILKNIWSEIKMASTSIHLTWPNHLLTWIGAVLVVFGLISSIWPRHRTIAHSPAREADAQLPAPILTYPDGRIFVSSTLTPNDLRHLSAGKTSLDAHNTVQRYIGKWMKVSGEVRNIYPPESYGQLVTFADGKKSDPTSSMTLLFFDLKWKDHVSMLQKGQKITAVGQIEKIEPNELRLQSCELISV